MKAYIGAKKKTTDGKYQYALTIYSERGLILHTSTIHEDISDNKFENTLKALEWGTKKLKTLGQKGDISENEPLTLFVGSKTVYTWFEKELAPEPYTDLFANLTLEMAFILNEVEIIFSQTADKRLIFKNPPVDTGMKVTELFAQV